jgi:hypothetical protein
LSYSTVEETKEQVVTGKDQRFRIICKSPETAATLSPMKRIVLGVALVEQAKHADGTLTRSELVQALQTVAEFPSR